jgi:hypothetical protein
MAWSTPASAPLPPGQNVAELYQEAARRLIRLAQGVPKLLARDRGIIELVRRVVHQPRCQFLNRCSDHYTSSCSDHASAYTLV